MLGVPFSVRETWGLGHSFSMKRTYLWSADLEKNLSKRFKPWSGRPRQGRHTEPGLFLHCDRSQRSGSQREEPTAFGFCTFSSSTEWFIAWPTERGVPFPSTSPLVLPCYRSSDCGETSQKSRPGMVPLSVTWTRSIKGLTDCPWSAWWEQKRRPSPNSRATAPGRGKWCCELQECPLGWAMACHEERLTPPQSACCPVLHWEVPRITIHSKTVLKND